MLSLRLGFKCNSNFKFFPSVPPSSWLSLRVVVCQALGRQRLQTGLGPSRPSGSSSRETQAKCYEKGPRCQRKKMQLAACFREVRSLQLPLDRAEVSYWGLSILVFLWLVIAP